MRLLLALVLLGAPAAALRGPCDLKAVEKKTWCPTCVMYVPRADVKGGACPKDKAKVETQDVCVKQVYVAKCHPTTIGLKPVTCCGILYDKGTDDLAKVYWLCEGCKEKAYLRDFRHPDTCPNRKVIKTCEKSGTSPHSTIGK
ncbi:MAG TPA: hypothetical protein VF950_00115 [Planctomycetota bacterium]